jgi:outer membrane protein, multidrug efflux system
MPIIRAIRQVNTLCLVVTCSLLFLAVPGCVSWLPVVPRSLLVTELVSVPDGWSSADATGPGGATVSSDSLAAWWQRFDDTLMSDLVSRALLENTSVAKAQGVLRQAQASRDVVAAALYPTLGVSSSVQHGTAGNDSTGNRFQLGADAQWAPDVFGAKRSALEANNALVNASAASLGDVQVQIAAEVGLNYILLRSLQSRWLIANSNLTSQKETLQLTDWRQQAGLISELEVERARAAAAQTQALLPALQISIEQTSHSLAVLTGQPPANLGLQLGGIPNVASNKSQFAIPAQRGAIKVDGPAETLRQRADVRTAEFQVAAAIARVGQAQAQRLPSFSIGGSFGLSSISLAALTKGASVLSSLLASVNLPLFDGGAARAQVRVQGAAFVQAQQSYRAVILSALKDVENALVALRGDQERLISLRIAANAAGNAAQLARQRYSSGLVDFQTVLDTQRTALSTADSVVSAIADIGNDQVRLFTALGGGWRESDSQRAAMR